MEFAILGPLEVRTRTGNRIRLGGTRQERLLATLLLNPGGAVPVPRLVDAVWEDRPPATADRQVRNLAGLLRRAFRKADPTGPPVLLTDGHGYRIPLDDHGLDSRLFADTVARSRRTAAAGQQSAAAAGLRQALSLWRGPVLDGLEGQLIDAGAVPLDELRLTAWEDCLDLDAALGRHRASIPELTGLVADHPLRERFVGQLMRALHASGRTADALTVHRRFTGRLAEELGLDPSPELRRLHLALLTAGVDPDPGRGSGGAGPSTGPLATRPRTAVLRGTGRPGGPADERAGTARATAATAAARGAASADPGAGAEAAEGGRGPRPGVPVPAQLPPSLATFTGRDAELAALDAFAEAAATVGGRDQDQDPGPGSTSAARICAVSGSAGIGKSTLVVQWAHRVRGRFPGGQLYADLHGFSAEPPLTPHAVLARFLRALGVPGEQVPSVPEEAAALYRSMLADRRVLVVLDNARSAEQVRPLLPAAPECLTVVTSRAGLAGLTARDGARPLALDLMPAPDAVALLDRVIGARRARSEPAAVAELAAVCGHLPLALAIAAGRLAERPGRTVADHVAELRDTGNRLTALAIDDDAASAVRATLDLSYRTLPAAARTLFRLLALAPGSGLTAAAAAALCGERVAVVRPVLDQLAIAHLLTHEGGDRYRLHDLLRLYAAERAAAETGRAVSTAARERLGTWYLHHADAAARLLTPHRRRIPLGAPGPWYEPPVFTTAAGAQRWCESEHTRLLGMVRAAAEHGPDALAWRLPVALWSYYFTSPHLDDREEAARLAVAAAVRAGDRYGEGHARNDLATALGALGRHDGMLAELRLARALFASIGDRVGEAHAIGNLGDHCLGTGAYGQARLHFQGALTLFRAQPEERRDDWAIRVCETNIGVTAMLAGRAREAGEYLHRALDRHRSTGDPVLESITLYHLGDHHRRLDRPEEAAARLRQALAVLDATTRNPRLRADVLAALARLGEAAGPPDSQGPPGG
ncbi:AfsR/SARP family transcriptional regulator [Kitasatospora purpeofusca]|uniref:Tetratricopeptide repeat protein n=1 Tax=Kitasatospora purpeofusca TaxID=67352 RepID=A0ABZ1UAR3_9ACTN|nr:BTAD domain-containing putative transcriptional regulator [Kitasatospora purpeofusca]